MRPPTPSLVVMAIMALAFLLSIKPHEATGRVLFMRNDHDDDVLLLPSLARKLVRTPSPNPGTYIPSSSTTKAINQMGFAGHAIATPPPPPLPSRSHPRLHVRSGMASKRK